MRIGQSVRMREMMLRPVLIGLGAAAFVWGATAIAHLQPVTLERMAERIVRGETYQPEELERSSSLIEAVQANDQVRATTLRAATIVTLRQAEAAISEGRRTAIDERLAAVKELLLRSLSEAPTEAFLWLVLFWWGNTVQGFDPAHVNYLAASYRLGPNEGWIAVRRSPLALAVFRQLPEKLQKGAATEFAGLVNSNFPDMATMLAGPGWGARDVLVPSLETTSPASRKQFARALYQLGYDVAIPGVERPDARPWRR